MKKIFSVILISLIAVIFMAGCGGKGLKESAEDKSIGIYKLESIMGMSISDAQDMLGEDLSDYLVVELKSDGVGTMTVEGEEYSVSWGLDGTSFTMGDGNDSIEGTLEDGKIRAQFEGTEVVFAKENSTNPARNTEESGATESDS